LVRQRTTRRVLFIQSISVFTLSFFFSSFDRIFSPLLFIRTGNVSFSSPLDVRWVYWYWQINNDVTADEGNTEIWSDIETHSSIGKLFFVLLFSHYNVVGMCFAYKMIFTCGIEGKAKIRTRRNIGKIFTLHNLLVM
jgi:hypothetical protein